MQIARFWSTMRPFPRSTTRGVTLLEISIGVAAAALVTGAALLLLRPVLRADAVDAAVRDAQRIRNAALDWREENPNACPTLTVLTHEKKLGRDVNVEDPWGERYRVDCSRSGLTVVSPGPDGRPGTDDDVRVPRS